MTAPARATTLAERQAFEVGQLFMYDTGENWVVVGETGERGAPLDWSFIDRTKPSALCRSCARILPLTCFQSGWDFPLDQPGKSRHPDCVICEYKAGELYKQDHCWELRAERTLGDHMRRERNQGLHTCNTLDEYMRLTGVTIEWLARKMRLAWENDDSCDHCETAGWPSRWREIVPEPQRDLSRMTIDRTDPKRLLARDNLTLMCLPGNIAKHNTDPRTYNIRQAYWRLHNHCTGGGALGR